MLGGGSAGRRPGRTEGGLAMPEFARHSPTEVRQPCNTLHLGTTLRVHGGFYSTPSNLSGKQATLSRPIVICAADQQWILGGQAPDPYWGDKPPAEEGPSKPSNKQFAF